MPAPSSPSPDLSNTDLGHLRRCVQLAEAALAAGDGPFGSVLVGPDGAVLAEDRNREGSGDQTRHPEFDLARWAGEHVAPDQRAGCTVYTSGEHCPMCAAAHAWVGLGRIVYALSARELQNWRSAWGAPDAPVRVLSINEVAPGITVSGPAPELAESLRVLHARSLGVPL